MQEDTDCVKNGHVAFLFQRKERLYEAVHCPGSHEARRTEALLSWLDREIKEKTRSQSQVS
jgi:hypothetical protein